MPGGPCCQSKGTRERAQPAGSLIGSGRFGESHWGMEIQETSTENKAKILLDEANLAFCEAAERKDSPNERNVDGSAWDHGKMDGEFDEEDYQKILEMQLRSAQICDAQPELEAKSEEMFKSVTPENAEEVLKDLMADPGLKELGEIAVKIFILRFPTVQSFVNKGHPLVLAMDEYMLENSNAQNWYDYRNIAEEYGWAIK